MTAQRKLSLVAPPRADDPKSMSFMLEDLARSGLCPDDIEAYPIAPIAFGQVGGYVIPYNDTRMYRIRYDRKEDKYIQPRGVVGVWWSPSQDLAFAEKQPTLYIIEGEKKAAAFVKKWPHLFAFGIGGAHMSLERLENGMRTLLPDIQRAIKPGMQIVAVFDGDISAKLSIQQAAHNLKCALDRFHVQLRVMRPPSGKGVDDWIVENPDDGLTDLIEVPLNQLEITRTNLYKALDLKFGNNDKPIINESNVEKILTNYYHGRVYRDRRLGTIVDGAPANMTKFEHECIEYIQHEHFGNAGRHLIAASVNFMFNNLERDLIQEAVKRMQWDGIKRLDTWGSEYLEAPNPKLANEWGRIALTGMTMRILNPGCKVDMVPIMVGGQGIGKTTFIEDLSTFEGHKLYHSLLKFSSDANDGNRSEVLGLSKAVIVDLGEGVIFDTRKTSSDVVKQRISQTFDTFRMPYANHTSNVPRGFIFMGTSNRKDLLSDATGSRRFLMLEVLKIKRMPYEVKLQILAEVAAQAEALTHQEWWQLRLTAEELQPPKIEGEEQEDLSYIKDVQELANIGFHKTTDFETFIISLIESGECATVRKTGKVFLASNYISSRYPEQLSASYVGRLMSGLCASPIFKYKIEVYRPRKPQLIFPQGLETIYSLGINNAQQMLNGFLVSKR